MTVLSMRYQTSGTKNSGTKQRLCAADAQKEKVSSLIARPRGIGVNSLWKLLPFNSEAPLIRRKNTLQKES